MSLEPGGMVDGSVRLDRKIGEGGMGSVWLADHRVIGRKVALKFLSPGLACDDDARARFFREARAVARIRSPHVAQILDVGQTGDGVPFMAMEYLKGQDLRDRLRESGPLTLEDTVRLVTHLATALSEVHAFGIIHRDVKPENVFLERDDDGSFVAKLLDFGIAKGPENAPWMDDDVPMGTPAYMSPEQLTRRTPIDARSDLWSLGVVAYECLTCRYPFDGDRFAALCENSGVVRFDPPTLTLAVPAAVDVWFLDALCPRPCGRFGSAHAMGRALQVASESSDSEVPFLLVRRRQKGQAPAG